MCAIPKPVLYIDIDGTVADSVPWWLSLYNIDHFCSLQKSEITSYDFGGRDLSMYYDDYRGVKPVEGSIIALTRLQRYYRIVFVTVGFGEHWLSNQFGFGNPELIGIKDRSLLRGYALIDDYDKNIEGFQGKTFLVKQPWNNGVSWEEIARELINDQKDVITDGVCFSPTEG